MLNLLTGIISLSVSLSLLIFFLRRHNLFSLVLSLGILGHALMYLIRAIALYFFPDNVPFQLWLFHVVGDIWGYTGAIYLFLAIMMFKFPNLSPNWILIVLATSYIVQILTILDFNVVLDAQTGTFFLDRPFIGEIVPFIMMTTFIVFWGDFLVSGYLTQYYRVFAYLILMGSALTGIATPLTSIVQSVTTVNYLSLVNITGMFLILVGFWSMALKQHK